ncbi:MAG TPA: hypothetical protein V6C97_22750 [Oculatellaceae cyanobacterium]
MQYSYTLDQIVSAYAMAHPRLDFVIIGPRTVEALHRTIAALELSKTLTKADLDFMYYGGINPYDPVDNTPDDLIDEIEDLTPAQKAAAVLVPLFAVAALAFVYWKYKCWGCFGLFSKKQEQGDGLDYADFNHSGVNLEKGSATLN